MSERAAVLSVLPSQCRRNNPANVQDNINSTKNYRSLYNKNDNYKNDFVSLLAKELLLLLFAC